MVSTELTALLFWPLCFWIAFEPKMESQRQKQKNRKLLNPWTLETKNQISATTKQITNLTKQKNQQFEPKTNPSSQMNHPRISHSVGVPDDGGECLGSLPQPCFGFWICVALTPNLRIPFTRHFQMWVFSSGNKYMGIKRRTSSGTLPPHRWDQCLGIWRLLWILLSFF